MAAFWDASALVPLCVPGQAGRGGKELLREHGLVVWWGSPVEVSSALLRLERDGYLTGSETQKAADRLDMLRRTWREVQPVGEVRDLAEAQLRLYALRAADALQLAAALVWCRQRPRRRTFVCHDLRLQDAARRAGFTVTDF